MSKNIKSLAVIGPLADDGWNNLGCWIVDGRSWETVTPLKSLKEALPNTTFNVSKGFADYNAKDKNLFEEAKTAAHNSDFVLMFMGEGNEYSG
jgi:beta-glucosidase